MPKKNNQNKPNGFIMFAEEIKNQLLMEGHSIRSKPDLIAAASPKWQQLGEEEKEYYKDKAKWEWENRHLTGGFQKKQRENQRDNQGNPLSQRIDLIRINEEKRKRERQEVFHTFEPGMEVLPKKFYFVAFISLLDEPTDQGWPPLEVGAVEFSLQNGIERFLHKFINPVSIPQGYRYKAQIKSEQHLMPVEGRAPLTEKYTNIYDELFNFFAKGKQIIPPIYSRISEIERVEGCLQYLAEKAGRSNQLKRLYELEGLIIDLDAHLRGNPQSFLDSKRLATDLLNSTIFDYDEGTKCDWHEEYETKYCALGLANRYCYCMGDYFCKEYDIPISEHHLPKRRSNEPGYTLIVSSEARKQQKSKEREKARQRSEDLFNKVTSKLALEVERQEEIESDDMKHQREQDEQRKRWLQLRGGAQPSSPPSQSIPNNNKTTSAAAENIKPSQPSASMKAVYGRGRGMGRGNLLVKNLRKPGEAPSPSNTLVSNGNQQQTNNLPMGRGLLIKTQLENDDKKYAGAISAPSAADAPRPPSTWVS